MKNATARSAAVALEGSLDQQTKKIVFWVKVMPLQGKPQLDLCATRRGRKMESRRGRHALMASTVVATFFVPNIRPFNHALCVDACSVAVHRIQFSMSSLKLPFLARCMLCSIAFQTSSSLSPLLRPLFATKPGFHLRRGESRFSMTVTGFTGVFLVL